MDYIQFQEHMDPKDLLLVAVGGALGACLRYLVIIWMPSENFPWATLSVNLIGSLALGIIISLSSNQILDERSTLLIATGILGAFTTMSTYSIETITLWKNNRLTAIIYVMITAIIGPILAFIGFESIQSGFFFNKN